MELIFMLFVIAIVVIIVRVFRSKPDEQYHPELLPDGSYEEELSFNIAGINYREGIADYVGEFEGYLQPDTQNEYDPNAIAVYHSDGHHLGFIPAYETQEVRELNLPFPIEVTGVIEQKHNDAENRDYFQGVVYVEVK